MAACTRRVLWFALGVIAVFCGPPSATAAPAASISGMYLIIPMDLPIVGGPPIVAKALSSPLVDGGFVRTSWNRSEPQKDQFDWSYLDAQIATLTAGHKKISIAVDAGQRAPDWLYVEGAKSFVTVVEIARKKDFCTPIKLPVPWDPVFLKEWTKFVGALGAHFSSNASVVAVKVTGIAYRTDELILPSGTGKTVEGQGIECRYPDDVRHWEEIGYTSDRVFASFRLILDAFSKAFPRQALETMAGERALPPLGPDGQTDTAAVDLVQTAFFPYGSRAYGTRFVGQVNSLSGWRVNQTMADYGRTAPIGFQAAWPVTGDPQCIMSGGRPPCDELQTMTTVLNTAVYSHARYVETFAADFLNPAFSELLTHVHAELLQQN
jgi:hypothetical protein